MYVCRVLIYTHIWRTGSWDNIILYCLHKFPHAITEVWTCGTQSPAIGKLARYAFTQLVKHKKVSSLSDYTRTDLTTTRLLCLILLVNVCGTCRCGHTWPWHICIFIFEYIYCMCVGFLYNFDFWHVIKWTKYSSLHLRIINFDF